MEDLVDVHVEHGEESIWIAFLAIGLYGGSNEVMRGGERGGSESSCGFKSPSLLE
jgi:hypothetical protein